MNEVSWLKCARERGLLVDDATSADIVGMYGRYHLRLAHVFGRDDAYQALLESIASDQVQQRSVVASYSERAGAAPWAYARLAFDHEPELGPYASRAAVDTARNLLCEDLRDYHSRLLNELRKYFCVLDSVAAIVLCKLSAGGSLSTIERRGDGTFWLRLRAHVVYPSVLLCNNVRAVIRCILEEKVGDFQPPVRLAGVEAVDLGCFMGNHLRMPCTRKSLYGDPRDVYVPCFEWVLSSSGTVDSNRWQLPDDGIAIEYLLAWKQHTRSGRAHLQQLSVFPSEQQEKKIAELLCRGARDAPHNHCHFLHCKSPTVAAWLASYGCVYTQRLTVLDLNAYEYEIFQSFNLLSRDVRLFHVAAVGGTHAYALVYESMGALLASLHVYTHHKMLVIARLDVEADVSPIVRRIELPTVQSTTDVFDDIGTWHWCDLRPRFFDSCRQAPSVRSIVQFDMHLLGGGDADGGGLHRERAYLLPMVYVGKNAREVARRSVERLGLSPSECFAYQEYVRELSDVHVSSEDARFASWQEIERRLGEPLVLQPTDPPLLLSIWASYGAGKTSFFVRYLRDHPEYSCLWVVPSTSLSYEAFTRLRSTLLLMCTPSHYKDHSRTNNNSNSNNSSNNNNSSLPLNYNSSRLVHVTTYESLHLLREQGLMQFDVCIFDEANCLLRYGSAPFADKNRTLNRSVLAHVSRRARMVVYMDADYSSVASLEVPLHAHFCDGLQLQPQQQQQQKEAVITNAEHLGRPLRVLHFVNAAYSDVRQQRRDALLMESVEQAVTHAIERYLAQGERSYIYSSSRTLLLTIESEIRKRCENAPRRSPVVSVFHGKLDQSTKRNIQKDMNAYIKHFKTDIFIGSPANSVGNSIDLTGADYDAELGDATEPYFSSVYAILSARLDVDEQLQAIHRPRKFNRLYLVLRDEYGREMERMSTTSNAALLRAAVQREARTFGSALSIEELAEFMATGDCVVRYMPCDLIDERALRTRGVLRYNIDTNDPYVCHTIDTLRASEVRAHSFATQVIERLIEHGYEVYRPKRPCDEGIASFDAVDREQLKFEVTDGALVRRCVHEGVSEDDIALLNKYGYSGYVRGGGDDDGNGTDKGVGKPQPHLASTLQTLVALDDRMQMPLFEMMAMLHAISSHRGRPETYVPVLKRYVATERINLQRQQQFLPATTKTDELVLRSVRDGIFNAAYRAEVLYHVFTMYGAGALGIYCGAEARDSARTIRFDSRTLDQRTYPALGVYADNIILCTGAEFLSHVLDRDDVDSLLQWPKQAHQRKTADVIAHLRAESDAEASEFLTALVRGVFRGFPLGRISDSRSAANVFKNAVNSDMMRRLLSVYAQWLQCSEDGQRCRSALGLRYNETADLVTQYAESRFDWEKAREDDERVLTAQQAGAVDVALIQRSHELPSAVRKKRRIEKATIN